MKRLVELIEKRKRIGKTRSHKKGGNYNDIIEFERLGQLIVDRVNKMHEKGIFHNLIELPLNIGEIAWIILKNEIIEDVVEDYDIWSIKNGVKLRITLQNHRDYVVGELNKTVFLTKEKAEKALADMRKKV